MLYIGVDVHKKYCHACVLDSDGNIVFSGKIKNEVSDLSKFFDSFGGDGKRVVLEAGYGWMPIFDLLQEKNIQVVLANQNETKAIVKASKLKTDKVDAKVLATLLRANLIPEVFAHSKQQRDLRALLRHRTFLVRKRTEIKNAIHGLLSQNNHVEIKVLDLFGVQGRLCLEKLDLPEYSRMVLDSNLKIHDSLTEEIDIIKKRINKIAEQNQLAVKLSEIRGVGLFSALSTVIEVGNIERFSSPKKFCRWIGVVPSTKQSGDKRVNGKITRKGNKFLRHLLGQCTNTAIKYEGYLKTYYIRLGRRKEKSKAKMACVRKLATKIWYTLHYANQAN